MRHIAGAALGAFLLTLGGCSEAPENAADDGQPGAFQIPVSYHKLDNGLKVVLSEDHAVPTVTVAVYYNIGFRIEPKGRTGFAHLFEHMMFQGTPNLPKGEFDRLIEGAGGVNNGSTNFDFTNYYEIVPAHFLEPMLWIEADRMRHLDFSEDNLANQQGVVKNEVKVNVLNRPYGGFGWLDMPQYANENWQNAHNFYGDLEELDAANMDDVRSFFSTYYAPNNAALVIAGDFDPAQTLDWVKKYFAGIPAAASPPPVDISEPRQDAEKLASREDKLAPRPALAFAYHMPERGTPEYFAMGIIDQVLVQGEESRLNQSLVKEKGYTDGIFGGINIVGNMFNYNGPMLWTVGFIHDAQHDRETIMASVDEVIGRVAAESLAEDDFERALRKMRSGLYDLAGSATRVGLVDLLAAFALYDDDPERINGLEQSFRAVTPGLVQQTARDYLRTSNRTVLTLKPVPAAEAGGDDAGGGDGS